MDNRTEQVFWFPTKTTCKKIRWKYGFFTPSRLGLYRGTIKNDSEPRWLFPLGSVNWRRFLWFKVSVFVYLRMDNDQYVLTFVPSSRISGFRPHSLYTGKRVKEESKLSPTSILECSTEVRIVNPDDVYDRYERGLLEFDRLRLKTEHHD